MGDQDLVVISAVQNKIDAVGEAFSAALPASVSKERWFQVAKNYVKLNPKLTRVELPNLFRSFMLAAQDGLYVDGREAAITPAGKDTIYMPMVGGLTKRVYESGGVKQINSFIIYENDKYEKKITTASVGNPETIDHVPPPFGQDRGKPIGAWAYALTTSGGIFTEEMTEEEINNRRDNSPGYRAHLKYKVQTPWKGNFYLEMWRKTVMKRLTKLLPKGAELMDSFHREHTQVPTFEIPSTKLLEKESPVTPEEAAPTPQRLEQAVAADEEGEAEKIERAERETEEQMDILREMSK